ncbi:hypothetical protein ASG31_13170 [Chryseobacterium sp. Leaf404]|uniref:T9SS type A sorting domain-containing protein n=1 Tax=unclassified Chryseobacterium TaxID=2593645 RepID=UPI0006F8C27F|nr:MULTISPECIES: T9SS type A sorting domain-containing protein [unclassified Chryseobacterium]KQT16459.1 hypothetical protein ASG31_13170 [Chryseobacterium sp. Leaf404]
MKKTLLSLTFCFSLFNAQTTVTKAFNDPVVGDVANYVILAGTPDNSATGANTTFNNASLTQGGGSPGIYSAPTSAEIASYPGSTLKYVNGSNTIFYKQTASKLEITALVTADATLNLSANNGTFITYPAAFSYSETDQAQGTFTSATLSGLCKGSISNSGDATGTLIVGPKTYTNVLRIKSVQNFNLHLPTDTLFLFPIGTIVNTSYNYYDSTHKFALLSTSQVVVNVAAAGINNQTTDGAQGLNEIFLAVQNSKLKNNFEFYPNPVTDVVHFRNAENANVVIYNLDGKVLKQFNKTQDAVQVADLPSGVYFITAEKDGAVSETKKLIKK